MFGDTRVQASSEQPGSGCFGRLEKPLPDAPLYFWLEIKVGFASRDRDEKFGPFQPPLALKKVEYQLRLGVMSQSDVCGLVGVGASEINAAIGVCWQLDCVTQRIPSFSKSGWQ